MSKIQLYNTDCLEQLRLLPENSIDMVLCDLPYSTTLEKWDKIIPMEDYIVYNRKNLTFTDFMFLQYKKGIPLRDTIEKFEKNKQLGLWTLYDKIVKPDGAILLFGQEPFSSMLRQSNIEDYRYDIYWEKERLTNVQQVHKRVGKTVESISVFYKKQPVYNPQMQIYTGRKVRNTVKDGTLGKLIDRNNQKAKPYRDNGTRYPTQVWKYSREFLKEEHHRTQKPIELLKNCILTFSNEGDTVLDNAMGWGSAGRAAILTNRNFIGIEADPYNFQKAEKILKNSLISCEK